jgi:hypothetical protein
LPQTAVNVQTGGLIESATGISSRAKNAQLSCRPGRIGCDESANFTGKP